MYSRLPIVEAAGASYVSSGHLPSPELIRTLVVEAYAPYERVDAGKVAAPAAAGATR
jgi:hypothetical protein